MQFDDRPLKKNLRRGGKWTKSSAQWLQRQLNDPYVNEAHMQGFRGRAAFKIQQMNPQFHFFKPGARVVDCAPAEVHVCAAIGCPIHCGSGYTCNTTTHECEEENICDRPNCVRCQEGNPYMCEECVSGYVLQSGGWCDG